ncbi:serine hydrolase domain-containing protein [Flavobacteriaceae bacterium S356]|uniref:Serine hydrolase domain-containing protein n=1 Tax=Asprobacillus argus TaxID=3076534 RepID=A0ABU3LDI3_9FLAO|nr:serine hydrolase domain-containing protein [Flavobacteriaceae bacterium S356]
MRLIIILLFGILLYSKETRSQNLTTAEKAGAIDSLFASYKNIPGCAVGIFQNGEILFSKGYGLANLSYDILVTDKTVFEAASVSKQFTAACITLLENEGKVNLEDVIQKYVPEIPKLKGKTITVGNLLYQTSGLRDYLALLYGKGISWNSNVNNSKALKILSKQKGLNFDPAAQFAYSNTNYMLLAVIVQKVTGKTIGTFAKERFFNPLGMKHTFYYEDHSKVIKNKAVGYEYDGNSFKREHYVNSTTTGDGGVYITIQDFFKWNENLKKGTVGGKDFVDKMRMVGRLKNGNQTNYGRGFFVGDYYDITGVPTLRHSGNWAGFRSVYCRFLKQDFTVVILSNNARTDVWGLLDEVTSLFIQDDIAKARRNMLRNRSNSDVKTIQLATKELQKFTGNYLNAINGELREVIIENDTLVYKRSNGRGTKLVPITNHSFVFLGAPQVVVEFNAISKSAKLTIGNGSPIPFAKYSPQQFTERQLKVFEGNYYNDELEVTYQITSDENSLHISIEGQELVRLTPVSKSIFRAAHFGYVKFIANKAGEMIGFSRHDDTISYLKFVKTNS